MVMEIWGVGRTGRDTFYTATAGKATDGRFGDALDVVAEDFAMTFCSAFSKTFPSFSTCFWMLAYVGKGKYGRKCNNVEERYKMKYIVIGFMYSGLAKLYA
jgi:hypothetical protein